MLAALAGLAVRVAHRGDLKTAGGGLPAAGGLEPTSIGLRDDAGMSPAPVDAAARGPDASDNPRRLSVSGATGPQDARDPGMGAPASLPDPSWSGVWTTRLSDMTTFADYSFAVIGSRVVVEYGLLHTSIDGGEGRESLRISHQIWTGTPHRADLQGTASRPSTGAAVTLSCWIPEPDLLACRVSGHSDLIYMKRM